ncbi:hypothetical protein MKW98_030599 [Papaver atlanticum]|uniref:Cupin type-1 domain-containing protein n=1 Tax=Papaver atlanticum TaxID=357466 RepID=A0AAD4SMH0_9MAGN|nr:hypothetical protein MKW98_030599 [Papaver atlanticum]
MIKTKFTLLVFLVSLSFLVSTSFSLGYGNVDPLREFEECRARCELQRGRTPREQQQLCEQRCEEKLRERQGRDELNTRTDPQQEYQQCESKCEKYERGQQRQCHQLCVQRRREMEREREEREREQRDETSPKKEYDRCISQCERQRAGGVRRLQDCERKCEERREEQERQRGHGNRDWRGRGEEQEENNPYHFSDQHFSTPVRTSEGHVRLLQKFTEKSELLRGLENYRVAFLEANPNTFIVPNHQDADTLFFVVRGRGSITMVRQEDKETHNLERGDVMRVPAGTVVYLINKDNNEKLILAKLLQTVFTPGHVGVFFGPGGEDPESYYSSFSDELLQTAFNTKTERLQRLFGQQRRGAIVKASEEQIRALSPHSRWPFGSESNGPYNILHHHPMHSNNYGQLYQVTSNQYRQLENLDVSLTFANITSGGMAGPYYNSRATKIAVVVEGNGYFEMACPHLSSSSSGSTGRSSARYQKVRAKLSRGDVIVAPAGHPIAAVASGDQNLQILCFEINARNNEKVLLAGRNNVFNQIERPAKEMAFNIPAREVEEILNNQEETFFFPGPNKRQEQGRAVA